MSNRTLSRRLRLLICTLKGGPGKTTCAWFLALAFASLGYKVVAVDADLGSRTLSSWYARAKVHDPVPFVVEVWEGTGASGNLSKFLRELEQEHEPDVVIVDTGGEQRQVFMSACLWADRLLMPVGPSLAEIERLHESKELAEEVAAASPLIVSALLTRVPPMSADRRAASQGLAWQARQLIEETEATDANDKRPYALHVMDTEISQNRHRYAVAFGYVTADTGEYARLAGELIAEMDDEQ